MAKPTTQRWTKMTIWPEETPGVFASKECGLNAKGFTLTGDMSETNVPDCDDPDAAVWVERTIRALSSGISGSGLMAEESLDFWRDWMLSALPKTVRVALDLATGDGYFEGSYVLNQFELNGNEGDGKIGITLAMSSDGPVAWVTGAPGALTTGEVSVAANKKPEKAAA